jgi:hypothetical protein
VQTLFEQEISGDMLRAAEQAAAEAERMIAAIGDRIERAEGREGR